MTEFKPEDYVGKSGDDVVRINILARFWNVIESFGAYRSAISRGQGVNTYVIAGRLEELFNQIHGMLKRRLKPEQYTLLLNQCRKSSNIDDLHNGFDTISIMLDEIAITRIDTREKYDSTSVETENKIQGY